MSIPSRKGTPQALGPIPQVVPTSLNGLTLGSVTIAPTVGRLALVSRIGFAVVSQCCAREGRQEKPSRSIPLAAHRLLLFFRRDSAAHFRQTRAQYSV